LDSSTFLVANSIILTAHIGQVLTTHQFNDWQVVHSADEVHYLASKLKPRYVIIDIAMVESNLATYCNEVVEKSDAAILLMLNHMASPVTSAELDAVRKQCPQIIGVFEFPVEAEKLVGLMVEHRNRRVAAETQPASPFPTKEMKRSQTDLSSGVAEVIQDHPEIISCAYLDASGKVSEIYGPQQPGQNEAAHYIMTIGRTLGENLGLTNLREAYQHGPQQKFLTLDTGEKTVTFRCTPKAVLREVAALYHS
jgi:chemotaxis response regulator CheB